MGMVRAFGVALVLVLAAVSCGDDSGEAGDATTTTAGVVDSVEAYFEALANPDSDQMVVAEQYAAPGSHADGYAVTIAEMYPADGYSWVGLFLPPSVSVTGEAAAECFPDPVDLYGWGSEPPPPPSEPAEPGEPFGGERCFDIDDTDVDDDGLLTGFTVDGNELIERLAPGGEPIESERVSFTLIGGYQDGIGTLHVVVEIANNSESRFIHQENRDPYVDPDGKQIDEIGFARVATASYDPATDHSLTTVTGPGVTDTVIAEFPSAAPGGTFTYGGALDDGKNTEVTVDIPITLVDG